MELGDTGKRKQPNIIVALVPLITVIVLLVCCQLFLNIEIHFPLLLGTIAGALIGVFYLKYPWHEIEKGIFVSYEVKSCMADYKSGFGQNFVTEKNYLVMPMELYKKVVQDIEGSVGVICPVPEERDAKEEFHSPTALDTEGVKWRMCVVLPCLTGARKRSMVELLFCMLRAGK